MKIIYLFTIISLLSCNQINEKKADTNIVVANKSIIDRVNSDTTSKKLVLSKLIIPDEKTAVAMAELILFNTYGKQQILDEKPYNIFKEKDNWKIRGSLPKNKTGGVFTITINSKNGEVLELYHGK